MSSEFLSLIVSHSHEFVIEEGIEAVFAMFSPEGETLWAPGWEYANIHGSTRLQQDYVFLTASHDHSAARAIWIVSDYDAEEHHVSYYKVEPEEKVGKVTVLCREGDLNSTLVTVGYKYIGLSASGNRFVAGFTKEAYAEFIEGWRALLVEYFEGVFP